MKIEDYKEHLFAQIISTADVRAQKASKGDSRSKRAEESLNTLAKNIENLPSSDPFFARACNLRFGEEMNELSDAELSKMSDAEMDVISQYGFATKGNGNPEQFLRTLVDKLSRAAVMAR